MSIYLLLLLVVLFVRQLLLVVSPKLLLRFKLPPSQEYTGELTTYQRVL